MPNLLERLLCMTIVRPSSLLEMSLSEAVPGQHLKVSDARADVTREQRSQLDLVNGPNNVAAEDVLLGLAVVVPNSMGAARAVRFSNDRLRGRCPLSGVTVEDGDHTNRRKSQGKNGTNVHWTSS
jgi:hypothetical protein